MDGHGEVQDRREWRPARADAGRSRSFVIILDTIALPEALRAAPAPQLRGCPKCEGGEKQEAPHSASVKSWKAVLSYWNRRHQ